MVIDLAEFAAVENQETRTFQAGGEGGQGGQKGGKAEAEGAARAPRFQ